MRGERNAAQLLKLVPRLHLIMGIGEKKKQAPQPALDSDRGDVRYLFFLASRSDNFQPAHFVNQLVLLTAEAIFRDPWSNRARIESATQGPTTQTRGLVLPGTVCVIIVGK